MKKAIALCLLSSALSFPVEKKSTMQRYGENDLQTIKTKVRFTTVILLPDGEEISEVTCGDREYWVIEGKDGFVYVKPAKEGAVTNVNIISKNKTVYSFLVQEISKPGSKEKPDLKVVLATDELSKLKKDKENLEELLLRSERTAKDVREPEEEQPKKKDAAILPPPPPLVSAPMIEATPDIRAAAVVARTEVPKPLPTAAEKPVAAMQPAASAALEEKPLVRVITVERSEGVIRKGGRLIGRFLRRVGVALRLY